MPLSTSNYKMLIEAKLDQSKIQAQLDAAKGKYKIDLEIKLKGDSQKQIARQMDEMAKAYNMAEKFLARAQNLPQNQTVLAAKGIAEQIMNAAVQPVSKENLENLRGLVKQFDLAKASISSAKTALETWSSGIKQAITNTLQYSLSLGLVYGALSKLKEGIQYIKELNKELVNIQVLQQEGAKTNAEIYSLAKGYNFLAEEMGATTVEIARGSTEWLRQGKTIRETSDLLKATLALSKLGNIDTALSTELLTATINGFQMETTDAIKVVDKLVSIDNIAATSVMELATAMQYSSAIANQTGVSFEHLAAMIGTVSARTRLTSEVIGQAFKTIFTRMQQVKAGEIDETGMSLNNVEKSLSAVGIKLRDSTDSFRPLGEVIDDVAKKWDGLNEVQRAQVSNAIAGVRQAQVFLSLMQNYGDVEKYMEAQTDSAGLAMNRYQIYLEGVEAAQNKLTAAVEGFWQQTISSGAITDFYNFLSGIVDFITNIGGLQTIFQSIIAYLIVIKRETIAAFADTGLLAIKSFVTAVKGAQGAMGKLTVALQLLKVDPIVLLASAAAALTVGIGYAANATKRLSKEQNDLVNDLESSRDSIKGLITSKTEIIDLWTSFDELRNKTSYTTEELEKYHDVQNRLKELIPQIAGHYDAEGNFILAESTNLKALIELKQKEIDLEKRKMALEASKGIKKELSARKLALADLESISDVIADFEDVGMSFDFHKRRLEETRIALEESNMRLMEFFPLLSAVEQQMVLDALKGTDLYNALLESVNMAVEEVEESSSAQVEITPFVDPQAIQDAKDKLLDMTIEMLKQEAEERKEALQDEIDGLEEVYDLQKDIYNDELEQIHDIADERRRQLQREHDSRKREADEREESIQDELDNYKKILDASRRQLQVEKERNDYQNSRAEKTDDLARIESEIAELMFDTSEEGIARRLELEEQAAEIRRDIAQQDADYQYELQMQALDNEERIAEESAQNQIDEIQREQEAYDYQYELELQAIEDWERANEQHYEILLENLEREFEANKRALESQIEAIDDYLEQEGTIRREAMELLENMNNDFYERLVEWNKKYGSGITDDIVSVWELAIQKVNDYASAVSSIPGSEPIITSTLGETGPLGEIIYNQYHSGADVGFVGGNALGRGNEEFAKLMKGELVVNPSQMDDFMGRVLPSLMGQSPDVLKQGTGQITVEMPINVSGNLDKTVLPDLEALVRRTVKQLNDNLMSRGFNRRAESFSV